MGNEEHGHNEYRGTEAQWAKRETGISGYVQGQCTRLRGTVATDSGQRGTVGTQGQ